MIKLYWEPTNPKSITFPDGLVEEFVEGAIQKHKSRGFISYTIGNELILSYFRVAIKEGKLLNTELEFYTRDASVLIIFDKDGKMDSIIGYPEYYDDSLNRIIGW